MSERSKYSALATAILVIAGLLLSVIYTYSSENSASQRKKKYRNNDDISLRITEKKELSRGVVYKKYLIGSNRLKLGVHVIEADISIPENSLQIVKAHDRANELEKLHHMIARFDSAHSDQKILGGINGNFWRAYSNRVIGPCVIDGEVVELNHYKIWTSIFFDAYDRMYIDRFQTSGKITDAVGNVIHIKHVNRRHDSLGAVIYNKFSGDTIPNMPTRHFQQALRAAIDTALAEARADTVYKDSTEAALDTIQLIEQVIEEFRSSSIENGLTKMRIKYLDAPAVNRDLKCVVLSMHKGDVAMPEDGFILSLGDDIPLEKYPLLGDTLTLRYSTDIKSNITFYNAICGTPRLVRNGVSDPEHEEENLKSRRFINQELPRTCIGTDKSQKKIFLATIEGTSGSRGVKGAHLINAAYAMRKIGAYNAVNLDGGGSTIMVIDNRNLLRSNPALSRRLAVGVCISKTAESLPDIFQIRQENLEGKKNDDEVE